jgi:hypothetical protein
LAAVFDRAKVQSPLAEIRISDLLGVTVEKKNVFVWVIADFGYRFRYFGRSTPGFCNGFTVWTACKHSRLR